MVREHYSHQEREHSIRAISMNVEADTRKHRCGQSVNGAQRKRQIKSAERKNTNKRKNFSRYFTRLCEKRR